LDYNKSVLTSGRLTAKVLACCNASCLPTEALRRFFFAFDVAFSFVLVYGLYALKVRRKIVSLLLSAKLVKSFLLLFLTIMLLPSTLILFVLIIEPK